MQDNELKIILSLVDEASAELKKSIADITDSAKKLGKETEKAGKTFDDSFKESTKTLRAFRRDLLFITGAVVSVYSSLRVFARYNKEAQQSVNDLDLSVKTLQYSFGFLIDKVLKFSPLMLILKELRELDTGDSKDKGFAGLKGITEATNEIKEYRQQIADINVLFQAGKIGAEEYFREISAAQQSGIAINEFAKNQIYELSVLQSQVSNEKFLEAQRLTQEQISLLEEYKTNYEIAHQGMAALTVKLSSSIRTNLTSAISDIILRVKSAKEAFTEFGQAMIRVIVEFMTQRLVAWLLEKTLLAGTVKASQAAGMAIAAAWADAALFVTLATAGANATGAITGIIATAGALAEAGSALSGLAGGGGREDMVTFTERHDGGMIRAYNGLAIDEVPIIAQTGEGILSRRGMEALAMLNSGRPNFSSPGSFGDISINIYGGNFSRREDINMLAEDLGFQLERITRNARSLT